MYYITDESKLNFEDPDSITTAYDSGYLFGRVHPGYSYQTRSLRIDLAKFSLTSENKRVLKKFSGKNEIILTTNKLPITQGYDWRLHKLAKDFYSQKFPEENFSANKVKELLTSRNHFNLLFNYNQSYLVSKDEDKMPIGYTICYQNDTLLHYCYPFYELNVDVNNLGMYMMLQAILWAELHGKKYIYLGGVTRPKDIYKLQFKGLSWWAGKHWSEDLIELKKYLREQYVQAG